MLNRLPLMLLSCLMIGTQVNAQRPKDTTQHVIINRTNSPDQMNKPYVIMISADGFRYDFAQKYHAENLLRLSGKGVRADYMIPSFPSLTFPNHYSLVTGLYPAHHGIVSNYFYAPSVGKKYAYTVNAADSGWYGGIPLWVLAEQQQMLSASFYWVGSEAAIQGVRPTYYYSYNEDIAIDKRIETLRNWLQLPQERRPHMITFYFPEVDHEAHTYGPESPQTAAAVQFVDKSIGKMTAMVDSLHLPVDFVFVSDHGMAAVDTASPIPLPAIDTSKFIISYEDVLVQLYAKDPTYVRDTYEQLKAGVSHYKVYLPDETPADWHYTRSDDKFHRIGDIILAPEYPKVFSVRSGSRIKPGKHGYDPRQVPVMRSTFMAWGPHIKKMKRLKPFENINVYPLVAQLLQLIIQDPIDGKPEVLKKIIHKTKH